MEKWLAKELELSRKHEELVMRREALLRGRETYFDFQDARSASFISDIQKAKQRNQLLRGDIDECISEMKQDLTDKGTPKFNTLKNNYWSMVKNVLPVWYEELQEYEARHGVKPFSSAPTPRDRQDTGRKSPIEVFRNTPRVEAESGDEATLVSVPPLDLDFSQNEDTTQSITGGKRVHYDEQSLRATSKNSHNVGSSSPRKNSGKKSKGKKGKSQK